MAEGLFTPPYPVPHKSKASLFKRFLTGWNSWIHTLFEKSYGMKLGTAYQIYDDCIDLVGDEKKIGKTLGTDLAKGKLTLPMLYLLRDATEQQRTKLQRMVLKGEPMDTSILAGPRDFELKAAKSSSDNDGQSPLFVFTFTTQQINCLRSDDDGAIIEGAIINKDQIAPSSALVEDGQPLIV